MIAHRYASSVLAALTLLAIPAAADPRDAGTGTGLGWSDGTASFVVHHWPDPVNAKNANFFLPNKDISFPAPGFPLEIERSYNSRSLSDGPFGFGWSWSSPAPSRASGQASRPTGCSSSRRTALTARTRNHGSA